MRCTGQYRRVQPHGGPSFRRKNQLEKPIILIFYYSWCCNLYGRSPRWIGLQGASGFANLPVLLSHRKDLDMTALRIALGIGVMVLFVLTVGCSGPSVIAPGSAAPPAPKQAGPPTPPVPVATIPVAKVKSISEAKPVDPSSIRGPRLAIDVDGVDFGDVPYQTVVAFSFNVKNVGTAPISLGPAFVRVKEGC